MVEDLLRRELKHFEEQKKEGEEEPNLLVFARMGGEERVVKWVEEKLKEQKRKEIQY